MSTTSTKAVDSHDQGPRETRAKATDDRLNEDTSTVDDEPRSGTGERKDEAKRRDNDPAVIDQKVQVERGGETETIIEHRPMEHANITNPGPEKQTKTVAQHVKEAKADAPDAQRHASSEPVELAQGDPDSIRRFEQLKKERAAGETPEDQSPPQPKE